MAETISLTSFGAALNSSRFSPSSAWAPPLPSCSVTAFSDALLQISSSSSLPSSQSSATPVYDHSPSVSEPACAVRLETNNKENVSPVVQEKKGNTSDSSSSSSAARAPPLASCSITAFSAPSDPDTLLQKSSSPSLPLLLVPPVNNLVPHVTDPEPARSLKTTNKENGSPMVQRQKGDASDSDSSSSGSKVKDEGAKKKRRMVLVANDAYSSRVNIRRSAMLNSLVRIPTPEARDTPMKVCPNSNRTKRRIQRRQESLKYRRKNFKPRSSRLGR